MQVPSLAFHTNPLKANNFQNPPQTQAQCVLQTKASPQATSVQKAQHEIRDATNTTQAQFRSSFDLEPVRNFFNSFSVEL
jgi:hypothetical protein